MLPEAPLSSEWALDLPRGCRWAVVLSHDMDHVGLRDHLFDGFLPGYAARLVRDRLVRRFRPAAAVDGLWGIALAYAGRDRWDAVDALLAAEFRAGVSSTWFVAVRRGLGIAYDDARLARVLDRLAAAGQDVGLHGQASGDPEALAAEVSDLAARAARPVLGARMHYLRLGTPTLDGFARAGLRYDSTVFERERMDPREHPLEGPRLVRPGLLEIPMHVMDSTLFSPTGLGLSGADAIAYTDRLFARAAEFERLVVLNLHTNTYSRQDADARAWYDDVLARLSSRSDVFVTDFAGLLPRLRCP